MSDHGWRRIGAGLAVAAALGAAAGGCRDDLAAPVLGRIEVRIEGASNVDVYLDGQLVGTDPDGLLGPLEPGPHVVEALRECFETLPGREIQLEVVPGEIAVAEFRLEARDFGSALITAAEEITGRDLTAEIWTERTPGRFVNTGLTTPAVLADLPCGPTPVLLQASGFESRAVTVTIDTGVQASARVELPPAHGALAEMFTYVICPNCPPAADELTALKATYPDDLYVIEWHTWQGLPLYDARWETREDYYTENLTPGWPLLVVQGDAGSWLVGSQAATLQSYRDQIGAARGECGLDCDFGLFTEGSISPAGVQVTAHVKWRSGPPPGQLVLRYVVVEDGVLAPGNQPEGFDAVPRDYHETPVSFSSPGEVIVDSPPPSFGTVAPAWLASNLGFVVYLQSDATKRVLAVHGSH